MSNPFVKLCMFLLVWGCAVERGTGSFNDLDASLVTDVFTEDTGARQADLSLDGTWLLFLEDRRCIYPDVGDQVENIVWTFYVLTMTSDRVDSPQVSIDAQMCYQYLSPLPFNFVTVVPNEVVSVLEPLAFDGFMTARSPESSFVTEQVVDAWGYREESARVGIPESAEDERVYDQDDDGKPGVTLQIETVAGMPVCEVNVVQRTAFQLEGTLQSGDRISGGLNVIPEQVVLDATSSLCMGGDVVPSGASNRFELVRLPAELSTCMAVRDDLPRIRNLLFESENEPQAAEYCPDREVL